HGGRRRSGRRGDRLQSRTGGAWRNRLFMHERRRMGVRAGASDRRRRSSSESRGSGKNSNRRAFLSRWPGEEVGRPAPRAAQRREQDSTIANAASRHPAVVMGLAPTWLHVVGTLGSAGVRVTGIGDRFQPGRFSHYLHRCILTRAEQERLDALLRIYPETEEGGRPVLIPTSDQDVQLI